MGDATLGCPVQEGPYLAVSPSAVGQPVVNVALVHGGEGGPTGLEPSQEFQRDTDPEPNASCTGFAQWPFGPAGPVQEIPDGVTTDQSRMVGRIVRQVPIQPRLDALEVLVARRQYCCANEDFAHIVDVPTGWGLVERFVTDVLSGARQIREQLCGGAFAEPDSHAAWIIGVDKGVHQWLQLHRNLTVLPRESVLEQFGGVAAAALVMRANTRFPAMGAAVVELASRTRTADAAPVLAETDENRRLAARPAL